MNRIPHRGSWLVVAALLVAVALSAVGLHAWRERGAWLRVPPGKVHLCVQLDDRVLTDMDWTVMAVNLKYYSSHGGDTPTWAWQEVGSERSSVFRPAYFQLALVTGGREGAFEEFRQRLRYMPELRLALIDEGGEVVRLESWSPPP